MFGESESESPRVPSPWDSLISLPPSPKPSSWGTSTRPHTPSPLSSDLPSPSLPIPRLVPESDDGNVEYKLQLLSPSPARFARLVTQLKWRLLEGGGQAYYELGVSDSGDLIGLPREDLERSLETLEMMAGEIGASVVVVKEIEVPVGMVELVARREGKRRGKGKVEDEDTDTGSSTVQTETETETESPSDTDGDDLSATVVLERDALFAMDFESDLDEPTSQPRYAIDLEIASVFKPRPVRTGVHSHLHIAGNAGGKNKKVKKPKHLMSFNGDEGSVNGDGNGDAMERNKAHNRRQARDRKREEKRRALTAFAAQSVATGPAAAVDLDSSTIVHGLEQMHVTIEEPATLTVPSDDTTLEVSSIISSIDISLEIQEDEDAEDDDDVFAPPTTTTSFSSFSTFPATPGGESFLNVPALSSVFPTTSSGAGSATNGGKAENVKGETRLIVEALVVRKMSLEEAFLDFGGFSLT